MQDRQDSAGEDGVLVLSPPGVVYGLELPSLPSACRCGPLGAQSPVMVQPAAPPSIAWARLLCLWKLPSKNKKLLTFDAALSRGSLPHLSIF